MDLRCQAAVSVKIQRAAESSETLWTADDTFNRDIAEPISKGHFNWPAVEGVLASIAFDHGINVNERVVALYSLLERYKCHGTICARELVDLVLDDNDNISVMMVYFVNATEYPSGFMKTFKYKLDTMDPIDLKLQRLSSVLRAIVNHSGQGQTFNQKQALLSSFIEQLLLKAEQTDNTARNRQYLIAIFCAFAANDDAAASDHVTTFLKESRQGWFVSDIVVHVATHPQDLIYTMAIFEQFTQCRANVTSVDFMHRIAVAQMTDNWRDLLYGFVEKNLASKPSTSALQLLAKLLLSLDDKQLLKPAPYFKPLLASFLEWVAYIPEALTLYQRSLALVD